MDQEEIKKSIAERFNDLQPEIQDAIMNSDYEKNIYEIAQKHKLSVEQMGEFESDTTLVMLGQIHPDEYNKELADDLNLPENKINEIVNDVNEKILKPIRELLKKNFENDDVEEAESLDIPLPPYNKPVADEEIKTTPSPITEKVEIKKPIETIVGISDKSADINDVQRIMQDIKPISSNTKISDKPTPKNIIEEKLKSPTISTHTVSSYTASPIGIPSSKPHDPYHEPIE